MFCLCQSQLLRIPQGWNRLTEIWECRVQCSPHSWSYSSVISRVVNIRKTPKSLCWLLMEQGSCFTPISFNARGQLYKFIIRKYIKMTQWALSRKENPTIHDIHRHDSEWVVTWSPPRVRIWRGLGDHLQIWTSSCSPQLCRGRFGECGSCDESSGWHCPLSHTHTLHMRASLKLRCSASCELLDLK